MTEERTGTALPIPSSLRASVERGDPWAHTRAVLLMGQAAATSSRERGFYSAAISAFTPPGEPDPSQAVTADAEPLDAEPDGDYPHGVSSHLVEFAPTGTIDAAIETGAPGKTAPVSRVSKSEKVGGFDGRVGFDHPTARSRSEASAQCCDVPTFAEFDRLAFLARVQRIDPRSR